MSYNIRGQEYQAFRSVENRKKSAHQSLVSPSDSMSEDDYNEYTSSHHHDDERYTNYDKPKFRKHKASYKRRFTIDPNQTFITVRQKSGIYSLEVSGAIHEDDKAELLQSASSLPVGLTLTLTEAFDKLDS